MSTRLPFQQLPPGCPSLPFDTDIVPAGFTMCTVPPVTSAPLVPMTLNIDTSMAERRRQPAGEAVAIV